MWGAIANFVMGPFLGKALDYLNKRQDTALEKFRIGEVSGKEVSIELIRAEIAGKQAQKEQNIVGMNHPVWWFAWGLFVFPVGTYHALIYWVSIFPELGWTIKQVPPVQEQWGMWIVTSLFGAQVTTGLISSIANRWLKR